VVTLGKDLACTSANPVFAAMVGREAERCLGMKVVDLIPGAPPALEDVVRGVLDTGTPRYRVAVDFHNGDATVRRCDITMFRFGSE
jgi:PAS domain-containing protein